MRLIHALLAAATLATVAYLGFIPPRFSFFGQPEDVPTLAELPTVNPATTAYMELRRQEAGPRWRPRQVWRPLGRISPVLVQAVLASEDPTFFRHQGVEWALTRAAFAESWRTGERRRGASTITQQLARNLYLSPKKTYWRKAREIAVAQRLEQHLEKRRILEIYLNVIEWGDGVFGAEAAARRYFGKSAVDLTEDEAVSLVAVIPNPRRHHPLDGSRWVESRKEWVYERLTERRLYRTRL